MEEEKAKKFLNGMEYQMRGFRIAERIVSSDLTTHYLVINRHIGDALRC